MAEAPRESMETPAEPQEEETSIEQVLLEGLVILPPRQLHPSDKRLADAVALPPLRAEEAVQSLRAALSEVVGYSHLTNFRFEVQEKPVQVVDETLASNGHKNLVSPYTGKGAVVSVPVSVKSLDQTTEASPLPSSTNVLDEYGNLTMLVEEGWHEKKGGVAFEIVLERYDAATIKEHLQRIRSLLAGNVPSVYSLADEEDVEVIEEEKREGEGEDSDKQPNGGANNEEETKPEEPFPPLPAYNPGHVSIDGTSGLRNFFYYASGEDPALLHGSAPASPQRNKDGTKMSRKKRKSKNAAKKSAGTFDEDEKGLIQEEMLVKQLPRLNELDEKAKVPTSIRYSGFHPPPAFRRLMGDLVYLEVSIESRGDDKAETIHITGTPTGFYVNNCITGGNRAPRFDPSPSLNPCFSHSLLDCLLEASGSFRDSWSVALEVSKERSTLIKRLNKYPVLSLFRTTARGDFGGFTTAAGASAAVQMQLDATLTTPSWLVPRPHVYPGADNDDAWTGNQFHSYNPNRTEEDITNTFGIDLRNGGIRDWNEELQLAREMPVTSLNERIERARLLHKVLTEFGEASLLGVKAIVDGHIAPMNPNESARSQVFLHNNIFFSRAVDAGPETFKIARGDKAARKAANRDIQCIGTFHRSEKSGLYTLATVLIDYLGTRYVCQSILPGILVGDKSHTLLYGSVETRVPLKWDEDLHLLLKESLGEPLMLATRPVFRHPLTEERMAEIQRLRQSSPIYAEVDKRVDVEEEKIEPNATVNTCIPIEAKGIMGSDQRKYLLDFGRLTPRDANWVPESKGGTGRFEIARSSSGSSKSTTVVPLHLEDDEWTMNVLRPELVTRFTQYTMTKYVQEKKKKEEDKKKKEEDSGGEKDVGDGKVEKSQAEKDPAGKDVEDKKEEQPGKTTLSEEDLQYFKTLKFNINVFLPNMRSFDGVDGEAFEQMKKDEQRVRDAAIFLWDEVIPKITRAVKDGSVQQIPVDGRTLTEFLHRNGVNCRYLGRLATLAKEEEGKDEKTNSDLESGRLAVIERRTMPKCWLELLECEMVARASKHLLDSYLTEHGGVAAFQPAQTIASFLSALISEHEETAGQTETRMEKRPFTEPDEEEFGALTISNTGGEGDAVAFSTRSRQEVWQDIELEVGRRFRYSLSLYNAGNKSGRALYTPLLRRICQRTGVRLLAKDYDVGGNCLCTGGNSLGGRLFESYPISPLDVVDIVPLMKHAAAYNEGFAPCFVGPTIALPPLQVSLRDARIAIERAHIQVSSRALGKGLELAQEAASLYQRVTENPAHPGVIDSIDLMASIFLDAGDPYLAAANGAKVLALSVQSGGFDTPHVFTTHMALFQMYHASRDLDRAVKHLKAAIYILEIMAGPRHSENYTAYHKLGGVYSNEVYGGKYFATAKTFLEEATKRDSCDRLMDGITAKTLAKVLGGLGEYAVALEAEKSAFRMLSMFLGREHQLTKDSENELKKLTKLASEKRHTKVENKIMLEQAAQADAVAAALLAEEETKSKKKGKKKGKK